MRAPIVPNRSPWVHTASASGATSRLVSAGGGIGREVDVATAGDSDLPEQLVADDPADQVEAVTGRRLERLGERAGPGRGPAGGADGITTRR